MKDGEKFLIFSIGDILFAIPLLDVVEVIDLDKHKQMEYDGGKFIKFKNEFSPIINLEKVFKIHPEIDTINNHRAVVSVVDDIPITLRINSDFLIANFSEDEMIPVPDIISKNMTRDFFTAVAVYGDNTVLVIDLEKLFSDDEIAEMKKNIDTMQREPLF